VISVAPPLDVSALLRDTADGVCAVDAEGRVVLWNRSAAKIVGYTSGEVLGRLCCHVLVANAGGRAPLCYNGCHVTAPGDHWGSSRRFALRTRTKAGAPLQLAIDALPVHDSRGERSAVVHLFRYLGATASPDPLPTGDERTDAGLTPRELEVLRLLAGGASTGAIAARLVVSPATVRNHVRNLLSKLGARTAGWKRSPTRSGVESSPRAAGRQRPGAGWFTDEMLESNRIIAESGLVFAGSGRNLQEARSPAYHMTRKGRVGMVGMHAYPEPVYPAPDVSAWLTDRGAERATYQTGFHGGLPGVNPMRLHRAILVPPDDLDALRKIAIANDELAKKVLAEAGPLSTWVPRLEIDTDPTSPVRLFTTTYALGDRGRQQFRMHADDQRLILRSVREAKEAADFVITAVNSRESAWTIPFDFMQAEPADFLITLAHEAIDNGADAFVASGVRVLRGIEIYRGRPIFYGLMSYNYQTPNTPVAYDTYRDKDLNPFTSEYTESELSWKDWPAANAESLESVVCDASFHDGKLTEVRIYPIEFGYGLPMSQKGPPRLSTGEVARRVLAQMQRLSEPLGTHIVIEDDMGIISVGPGGRSVPGG
jgi:PAS domain S-box-containing protein